MNKLKFNRFDLVIGYMKCEWKNKLDGILINILTIIEFILEIILIFSLMRLTYAFLAYY